MVEKLIRTGMNGRQNKLLPRDTGRTRNNHQNGKGRCEEMRTGNCNLRRSAGTQNKNEQIPGGSITLEKGKEIKIIHSEKDGEEGLITTNFAPLITDVNTGERILMDDGMIELTVARKEHNALICTVVYGGTLKDRKGINLPHTKLKVTAMTDKDRSTQSLFFPLGVDFIALSFVRSAEDVGVLRKLIESKGFSTKIIAKLKNPKRSPTLTASFSLRMQSWLRAEIWQSRRETKKFPGCKNI